MWRYDFFNTTIYFRINIKLYKFTKYEKGIVFLCKFVKPWNDWYVKQFEKSQWILENKLKKIMYKIIDSTLYVV